jgi:hypothetical protein
MLTSLYNDGVLSEHMYSEPVTEVNAALLAESEVEKPARESSHASAP